MNEPRWPADPPSSRDTASHPGPPSGWRPTSALAVTAFVVSLLTLPVAFALGFFLHHAVAGVLVGVVAVALAVWATIHARPAVLRGRTLAIVGLILSLMGAGCGAGCHAMVLFGLGTALQEMHGDILHLLDAEMDETERVELLERWVASEARDEGLVERMQQQFEAAEARLGDYERLQRPPRWLDMMMPDLAGYEPIDPRGGPLSQDGSVLWGHARFEHGVALVGVATLEDGIGEAIQPRGERTRASVVRDFEIFVREAGTPPRDDD